MVTISQYSHFSGTSVWQMVMIGGPNSCLGVKTFINTQYTHNKQSRWNIFLIIHLNRYNVAPLMFWSIHLSADIYVCTDSCFAILHKPLHIHPNRSLFSGKVSFTPAPASCGCMEVFPPPLEHLNTISISQQRWTVSENCNHSTHVLNIAILRANHAKCIQRAIYIHRDSRSSRSRVLFS